MLISKTQTAALFLALLGFLIIGGCGAHRRVQNSFMENPDSEQRAHPHRLSGFLHEDDIFIGLAFSGGGTRAAAFSYGVLSELRDTNVTIGNDKVRLLDEVDHISSVSGGSFTAAYYGLFGDRIFDDYETVFLRRNVQKTLVNSLFNPINWVRFFSSGFDRGTISINYFDKQIFQRKTFGDIAEKDGPFIQINATDLRTGQPFWFTSEAFAVLCSNLYDFKVASAVAASAAVPIAFPPVTLKNYSGCGNTLLEFIEPAREDNAGDIRKKTLLDSISVYADKEQRQYIHLVDGGIADNLGVRSMLSRMFLLNEARKNQASHGNSISIPKKFVLILVNAQTAPGRPMDLSPKAPSSIQVISAASAAHIARDNQETLIRTKQLFENAAGMISSNGQEVSTYFIELKFNDIPDTEQRYLFNNMATSYSLPDEQVDLLYESGRQLLRDSAEFQRLLQNLKTMEK